MLKKSNFNFQLLIILLYSFFWRYKSKSNRLSLNNEDKLINNLNKNDEILYCFSCNS